MFVSAEKIAFKNEVKKACVAIIYERIKNASNAMEQAQESANNQEKSSVGDKHETARAIGQAERDMNARQLLQAKEDLRFLETIQIQKSFLNISTGSLFQINEALFFVAVGLGSVKVTNKVVTVISHLSPLFGSLKMKKLGDTAVFQDKKIKIVDVY